MSRIRRNTQNLIWYAFKPSADYCEDDCVYGVYMVHSRGVKKLKARHLNNSNNQSKFGLIQPLFPIDDMLACTIRVLSVPRRKTTTTNYTICDCNLQTYISTKYYCHLNARFISLLAYHVRRYMLPKANQRVS